MFASKHLCRDIPIRGHLHSLHTQAGIHIHCITKGAFASWHAPMGHSHHGILPRGHSYHGILLSRHSHHGILSRRRLHSLHTQASISIHCILTKGICIMAYSQKDIRIMAYYQRNICFMTYPQGGIYIMTYLHEYLHHDIHTWTFTLWYIYKKHLHHDIPIRRHLHRKTFASPSL